MTYSIKKFLIFLITFLMTFSSHTISGFIISDTPEVGCKSTIQQRLQGVGFIVYGDLFKPNGQVKDSNEIGTEPSLTHSMELSTNYLVSLFVL